MEVPPTPGMESVSIAAHESVDRESNAIPVHPITAGSANLPDWRFREVEETLENNIRGPQGNRKRGTCAKGYITNFIVNNQSRSENLERTKDGT